MRLTCHSAAAAQHRQTIGSASSAAEFDTDAVTDAGAGLGSAPPAAPRRSTALSALRIARMGIRIDRATSASKFEAYRMRGATTRGAYASQSRSEGGRRPHVTSATGQPTTSVASCTEAGSVDGGLRASSEVPHLPSSEVGV